MGLANHIVGPAPVAAIGQAGEVPDAALGAAVRIAEVFVQHAFVALPAAIHHHGEALHDVATSVLEQALGVDPAIEELAQVQGGFLGRIVAHLGAGTACQRQGGGAQGVTQKVLSVHGVSVGEG